MYSDFRSTLIYPDPKNRGMRGPAVFQVSLGGSQKFFLIWVAGIILVAWDVELESAHFVMF